MQKIMQLLEKKSHLVIGLMSGTCTDGIDAALVQIEGCGTGIKVELLEFVTIPYSDELRNRILQIAAGNYGGSYEISKANFLLGTLSAEACMEVCGKAKIPTTEIDFIGSHGHTVYHQPVAENYWNHSITSTLQIGEAAVISEAMNCPVFADFRVRDMAAGGLGAPLVPYTEYLLYSQNGKNIALQNIGGIGNITFLPEDGNEKHILAFDTGPGNMIVDALVSVYTKGRKSYDEGGKIAAGASVHRPLLEWLMKDEYLFELPPKTTGREHYGKEFVKQLLVHIRRQNCSMQDAITTATVFTAKTIEMSVLNYLPAIPEQLIIGGGGSSNPIMVQYIKDSIRQCKVITNEEIGLDSNAKEAIAFAVLANESLYGICNNVPSATGAKHGVVMGKLTI